MKVGQFTERLRFCCARSVGFHVYNRRTGTVQEFDLTVNEIFTAQRKGSYPELFSATLESIDLRVDKVMVNCSIRK